MRQVQMLNISYNISPKLNEYLSKIEDLRRQILLTPIPKALEQRLRWEATLNRIYYSLLLAGSPMKKNDALKILSEIVHGKLNDERKEILRYKEALDYISQNWQGSQNAIDADAIIHLHGMIGQGGLRVPKAGLQSLLDYLQTEGEGPIIQAAIVSIEMEKMQLFTKYNTQIAHLTTDLFLHKYGYDLKGFLAYEAAWMENPNSPAGEFREIHERALNTVSLTLWLEYFAQKILEQMETIIQEIRKPKLTTAGLRESFWQLNERQKAILNLLVQPQTTITNRQIQNKFKTTQITASRDLARLTNLGHLLSHGKGRSVFYTKI